MHVPLAPQLEEAQKRLVCNYVYKRCNKKTNGKLVALCLPIPDTWNCQKCKENAKANSFLCDLTLKIVL